jgi:hypothetical protein
MTPFVESDAQTVDEIIGEAYTKVALVADNLDEIGAVADALASITSLSAAIANLNQATTLGVSLARETWAGLSALSGSTLGQTAAVYDDDGTHVDPVSGDTVSNRGTYSWDVEAEAWTWVRDFYPSQIVFTDLGTITIPAEVTSFRSDGYNEAGKGAAFYVHDAIANAGLALAHPRACKADKAGRYFRLIPGSNGLADITAVGINATETEDNSVNHRTGIAALAAYNEAVGIAGIQFETGHYSIWAPVRVEAPAVGTAFNIGNNKTGVPFVLNKPHVWVSGVGETVFNRRKSNGTDPNVFAGTQMLSNGQNWRGGMFILTGENATNIPKNGEPVGLPDPSTVGGLRLKGTWDINGGIPTSLSNAFGDEYGNYILNPDGSGRGWDISDKMFWYENDKFAGDLIFEGYIKGHGFRGEHIYGGAYSKVIGIGTLELYDGDSNGFNIQTANCMQFDTVILHDFTGGIEGWTGRNNSWIKHFICYDMGGGGLAGGHIGDWLTGGDHFDPTTATVTPKFTIGLVELKNVTKFNVGPFTQIDRIISTDSLVTMGNDTSGPYRSWSDSVCSSVGTIVAIADQTSPNPALRFYANGGTAGLMGTRYATVDRLICARTPYAQANGHLVTIPVSAGSSLGPGCFVGEVIGESSGFPSTSNVDHGLGFGPCRLKTLSVDFGLNQDIDTLTLIKYRTPVLRLDQSVGTAIVTVTISTGGFDPDNEPPTGSLWTIKSGTTKPVIISSANTRMPHSLVLLSGSSAVFEYEGYFWMLRSDLSNLLSDLTVAQLPAATAALRGLKGYVTDATVTHAAGIGTAPVGGAANYVPVTCNGVGWVIG